VRASCYRALTSSFVLRYISFSCSVPELEDVESNGVVWDSARKTRSAKKRRQSDDATTITNYSEPSSTKKPRTTAPGISERSHVRKKPDKAEDRGSKVVPDANQARAAPLAMTNSIPTSTLTDSVLTVPIGTNHTTPIADSKQTCKDKIQACLEALNLNHQEGSGIPTMDVSENSRIADNMKDLLSFLHASVQSEGRHSGSEGESTALYVGGGPGVGKTSAVKWCCKQVIAPWNNSDNSLAPESKSPFFVHINVNHVLAGQSSGRSNDPVRSELSQRLGVRLGTKSQMRTYLNRTRKTLILILDEVDALVRNPSVRANQELANLMDSANDETVSMVLIGISNSVGDATYERLQNSGQVSMQYTADCKTS